MFFYYLIKIFYFYNGIKTIQSSLNQENSLVLSTLQLIKVLY